MRFHVFDLLPRLGRALSPESAPATAVAGLSKAVGQNAANTQPSLLKPGKKD